MPSVEVAPHLDDGRRAPRVEGKGQADISDEEVEALLAVEGRPGQWEGHRSGVLDVEGEGSADVTDGGVGHGAEAGGVRPLGSPRGEAAVGWGLPGVHPHRHDRQQTLVRRELTFAFAEARVGDVEERGGDAPDSLHRSQDGSEQAQHAVRERFGFLGGPAVEAARPLVWAGSDEAYKLLIGEGERRGFTSGGQLLAVFFLEGGPCGRRLVAAATGRPVPAENGFL